MPLTVYIAGPISGNPNYAATFAAAEAQLKADGYIPMNPAALLPQYIFSYDAYLRMSMAMLHECNAIYLLPGWESSTGAQAEFRYADENQLVIIFDSQADVKQKEVPNGQETEVAAL